MKADTVKLRLESTCAVCDKTAQSVELAPPAESPTGDPLRENERLAPFARFLRGEGGTLITTGVNGEAAFPLPVEHAAAVRSAIERNDWQALFAINREWDPSWCRECGAHYCDAHWHKSVEFDDGSYDCTWGDCPKGHRRKLDD